MRGAEAATFLFHLSFYCKIGHPTQKVLTLKCFECGEKCDEPSASYWQTSLNLWCFYQHRCSYHLNFYQSNHSWCESKFEITLLLKWNSLTKWNDKKWSFLNLVFWQINLVSFCCLLLSNLLWFPKNFLGLQQ